MKDGFRGAAELLGLLMVAASLLFVAFQMQQDRRIAQADLNTAQLEIYASRYNAGLESDSYLTMWHSLYSTKLWDTGTLSEKEIAAAELDALLWWTYAEVAFEQHREGLASDNSWEEVRREIVVLSQLDAHKAVYEFWYREMPSDFTRAVDEILEKTPATARESEDE